MARNRNKVTELYGGQPIGGSSRVEVGKPLRFFRGYVMEGIFQSYEEIAAHATQVENADPRRATAPGDVMFKDLNGDGVINADDQTMIGSPWPDYEGGWTNDLSLGSLDLSAFVQFSQGNDIRNGFRTYADQFGSYGDNNTARALNRWTPTHTNTNEPRAVWGDPNQNTRDSSRFIEDGSYVRLKNVVLGYTLPTGLIGQFGLRTARVYVQGQNVFTQHEIRRLGSGGEFGGRQRDPLSDGTSTRCLSCARSPSASTSASETGDRAMKMKYMIVAAAVLAGRLRLETCHGSDGVYRLRNGPEFGPRDRARPEQRLPLPRGREPGIHGIPGSVR